MAKREFLLNLRTARNLFVPRVQTDHPSLDPRKLEGQLARAAIWLTRSAVKGFDANEFQELAPDLRAELKENVERFLRVAEQVYPSKPATEIQIKEGMMALGRVLDILKPYLPTQGEVKQVEEALENIRFPDFVLGFDYELGADSMGDPAVWIWVLVKDEAANRADLTASSTEMERRIREALNAAGSTRWPFVRLRTASEQRALWRAG
jgi:hypothetical protein